MFQKITPSELLRAHTLDLTGLTFDIISHNSVYIYVTWNEFLMRHMGILLRQNISSGFNLNSYGFKT